MNKKAHSIAFSQLKLNHRDCEKKLNELKNDDEIAMK